MSRLISAADVDRLVLTRRYEMLVWSAAGLLSLAGGNNATRVLNDLISTELDERVAAFDAAIAALQEQITRWDRASRYAVLDTCVYLEHVNQLETLNLAAILSAREAPIRILVPMMVLDELDGAKRFSDDRRGRATVALAVIDRVVRAGGVLRERDLSAVVAGEPRPVPGEATVEVLNEAIDHVRLPIADAEIVDQALTVQAATGVPVWLLTFDTTMALRAREAGLDDRLLPDRDRVQDLRARKKNRANGTSTGLPRNQPVQGQ